MKSYKLSVNNKDFEVVVKEVGKEKATVEVNGQSLNVDIKEIKNLACRTMSDTSVATPAAPATTAPAAAQKPAPAGGGGAGSVVAPIPGQVKQILVKVGDTVDYGANLLVMEAMKMENMVSADKTGVVEKVCVAEGDSVAQDQELLVIGGN
jgi:glutaconyl-CoA decarboxylase